MRKEGQREEFRLKDLSEYLLMGGDGIFIWSSYFVALVLLAGIAAAILMQNQRLKQQALAAEASVEVRSERSDTDDEA